MPYLGRSSDFGVRNVFHFLASAGDTSVSGNDADGKALIFTDGRFVDVYLNGVRLKTGEDYNTATANTIAGISAMDANDEVNVVVFETFNVANTVPADAGGSFGGDVTTEGTFNALGDTAAGDKANMGFTTAEGLILTGQGTTNDVTIKNDADTSVIQIPTGTDDVNFTDDISLKSDSAVIKFGADEEITLTHNHNAGLTLGGTTPTLTIGDAGAEDTKIVFDGNAQDFHIGLDDSADSLTIGLGSTLGTTSHMIFDENGHISKPLQPAFLVTRASQLTNVGIDTNKTIDFSTERFDQNGDFADPKFTAPITGRYQFNVNIYLENIPNDLAYFTIRLVTSNREYYSIFDPGVGSAATSYHSLHISALADMDASDTAFVNCYTPSGTNNTDVAGSHVTSFSGYLVA